MLVGSHFPTFLISNRGTKEKGSLGAALGPFASKGDSEQRQRRRNYNCNCNWKCNYNCERVLCMCVWVSELASRLSSLIKLAKCVSPIGQLSRCGFWPRVSELNSSKEIDEFWVWVAMKRQISWANQPSWCVYVGSEGHHHFGPTPDISSSGRNWEWRKTKSLHLFDLVASGDSNRRTCESVPCTLELKRVKIGLIQLTFLTIHTMMLHVNLHSKTPPKHPSSFKLNTKTCHSNHDL